MAENCGGHGEHAGGLPVAGGRVSRGRADRLAQVGAAPVRRSQPLLPAHHDHQRNGSTLGSPSRRNQRLCWHLLGPGHQRLEE